MSQIIFTLGEANLLLSEDRLPGTRTRIRAGLIRARDSGEETHPSVPFYSNMERKTSMGEKEQNQRDRNSAVMLWTASSLLPVIAHTQITHMHMYAYQHTHTHASLNLDPYIRENVVFTYVSLLYFTRHNHFQFHAMELLGVCISLGWGRPPVYSSVAVSSPSPPHLHQSFHVMISFSFTVAHNPSVHMHCAFFTHLLVGRHLGQLPTLTVVNSRARNMDVHISLGMLTWSREDLCPGVV